MGIVWVKEIDGDSGSIDDELVRRFKRRWRVRCDDPEDDPLSATATGDLPALFTYYTRKNAVDFGATLRNYESERSDDDPRVFIVTGSYSSERRSMRASDSPAMRAGGTGGTSSRGSEEERNPLLRPASIRWGAQKFQEPAAYCYDFHGKPTIAPMNSARQPFTNVPQRNRCITTATIRFNAPGYDPRLQMFFQNTFNGDVVTLTGLDFQPGTIFVDEISGDGQWENDVYFFAVTIGLSILENRTYTLPDFLHFWDPHNQRLQPFGSSTVFAWDDELHDVGTRHLVEDTNFQGQNQSYPNVDAGGITEEYSLDGKGHRLNPPEAPHYIVFRKYKAKSLQPLLAPFSQVLLGRGQLPELS